MVDSEHLTYRDCQYYTRISAGDEAFSRCYISGKICDADEPGLVCDLWEEEKAEIHEADTKYKISQRADEGRQFRYYHYGIGKYGI